MVKPNQLFGQKKLPAGATIAPILIVLEKTQLSNFNGDISVWLVYLMIGNIEKCMRCIASSHATILISYIPVSKLKCFSEKWWQHEGSKLWHSCMKLLLRPLVETRKNGIKMVCSNKRICWVFPIPFAYIADHPEQCLVACNKQNWCSRCKLERIKLGGGKMSAAKTQKKVLKVLDRAANGDFVQFNKVSLHPIDPFWHDLPHCKIFSCFTPDLLHQPKVSSKITFQPGQSSVWWMVKTRLTCGFEQCHVMQIFATSSKEFHSSHSGLGIYGESFSGHSCQTRRAWVKLSSLITSQFHLLCTLWITFSQLLLSAWQCL